jgi:Domain of unknown function (DUF1707)
MDDRIRVSDADRDRVAARLRDHFAEGRLTSDEMDERVSATLSAKTVGDLRRVMADLPGGALVPPPAEHRPRPAAPSWAVRRHRPRIVPLILLALLVALLIPGSGWLLFALVKIFLVFWLVVILAGVLVAGRLRRRMHHYRQSGFTRPGGGYTRW